MSRLAVNEVFDTLQGEATFTGMPSTFVRLQGCDVGCPWCDTKHTWTVHKENERSLTAILSKTAAADATYATVTARELVAELLYRPARHVVITGGEPFMHDLTELTDLLIRTGFSVQIETSGTRAISAHQRVWITLSPKLNMPGGLPVLRETIARANELKMPVGKMADIAALHDFIGRSGFHGPVWLQPLSRSEKATALCIEQAARNGWRVSIQTHALLGLR